MYKDEFTPTQSFESKILERPGFLVTGAHHAREPTTISMSVYLMLKFLWAWVKTEESEEENLYEHMLLKSAVVFFVPTVNIDGFKYISDMYKETGRVITIRKNMAPYINP